MYCICGLYMGRLDDCFFEGSFWTSMSPAPREPFNKNHVVVYFPGYDHEKHHDFDLIQRIIGKTPGDTSETPW